MALLQVKISERLKDAIDQQSKAYDVPASTLVKIILTQSFMGSELQGNVFNADRDNNGKGLQFSTLINMLDE